MSSCPSGLPGAVRRTSAVGAVLVTAMLVACGTPGAPQPPSLGLPMPVRDLRAARQGDRVVLSWTPPHETTDRQGIRHPGPVLICRKIDPALPRDASAPLNESDLMDHCENVIATIVSAPPSGARPSRTQLRQNNGAAAQQTYADLLPQPFQQQHADAIAVYAVDVQNPDGKSAGLSNQAWAPLAPTWPAPTAINASVTASGVEITWTGTPSQTATHALGYRYVVYRQDQKGKQTQALAIAYVPIGGEANYSVLDRTFSWETTYLYSVGTVTDIPTSSGTPLEVVGDRSPATEVTVHDVFAPSQPSGVEAVFSAVGNERFIDLTWSPNTDADLAGYNVYRHEHGTQPVRINRDLIKAPAFRDTEVAPGHEYFYSVSAVDLRGNESPRSPEARETVPGQR